MRNLLRDSFKRELRSRAALATLVGNMVSGWLNILFLHRVGGTPIRHFWGLRRSDLRIIADKAGAAVSRLRRTPDRRVAP